MQLLLPIALSFALSTPATQSGSAQTGSTQQRPLANVVYHLNQWTWKQLFTMPFQPSTQSYEVFNGPILQAGIYNGTAGGEVFILNAEDATAFTLGEILADPMFPSEFKSWASAHSFSSSIVQGTISTSKGYVDASFLTAQLDKLDGYGISTYLVPIGVDNGPTIFAATAADGCPPDPGFCPDAVACKKPEDHGKPWINPGCMDAAKKAYEKKVRKAGEDLEKCKDDAMNKKKKADKKCQRDYWLETGGVIILAGLGAIESFGVSIAGGYVGVGAAATALHLCHKDAQEDYDDDVKTCDTTAASANTSACNDYQGDIAGCCQTCNIKPAKKDF